MTIYIAFNKTGRAFTRTTKRDYEFAIFSGTTCQCEWENDGKATTCTDTTENMAGRVDLAEKGVESLKKLGYVNAYYAPVEEVQIEKKAAKVWEATADGRTITATTKSALVEMIHYEGAFDRVAEEAPVAAEEAPEVGTEALAAAEEVEAAAEEDEAEVTEASEEEAVELGTAIIDSLIECHGLYNNELIGSETDATVGDLREALKDSPAGVVMMFVAETLGKDRAAFMAEAEQLIIGKRQYESELEASDVVVDSWDVVGASCGTVTVQVVGKDDCYGLAFKFDTRYFPDADQSLDSVRVSFMGGTLERVTEDAKRVTPDNIDKIYFHVLND